jgi:hypothetical protein
MLPPPHSISHEICMKSNRCNQQNSRKTTALMSSFQPCALLHPQAIPPLFDMEEYLRLGCVPIIDFTVRSFVSLSAFSPERTTPHFDFKKKHRKDRPKSSIRPSSAQLGSRVRARVRSPSQPLQAVHGPCTASGALVRASRGSPTGLVRGWNPSGRQRVRSHRTPSTSESRKNCTRRCIIACTIAPLV